MNLLHDVILPRLHQANMSSLMCFLASYPYYLGGYSEDTMEMVVSEVGLSPYSVPSTSTFTLLPFWSSLMCFLAIITSVTVRTPIPLAILRPPSPSITFHRLPSPSFAFSDVFIVAALVLRKRLCRAFNPRVRPEQALLSKPSRTSSRYLFYEPGDEW